MHLFSTYYMSIIIIITLHVLSHLISKILKWIIIIFLYTYKN